MMYKNILIVRVDRVGDVLLTLPVMDVIKKGYPNASLSFLGNDYTIDLVKGNPNIKNCLVLQSSFFKNYVLLKKFDFDTVLLISPVFNLALIFFLLNVKNRIGTGYRWYSFLFNKKHYEHRRYGNKHELEYNLNLLSAMNLKYSEVSECKIYIEREDENVVERLLLEKGIKKDDKLIIIHPGSKGSSMDYPKEKMINLVKKIDSLSDYKICFTGKAEESDLVAEINESISNRGFIFIDELSLKQLSFLIKRGKIFISNSTGPIHLAAAVGTFIIGFYPPVISMSEKRWGPYTLNKYIFVPKFRNSDDLTESNYCKKCIKDKCKHFDCMNSISEDEVFHKVKEFLIINESV